MSAQRPLADNRHYTATAKWLHWSMAALWLAAWVLGVLAVYWRDTLNPHHGLTYWHKALASALLFLIVIRLVWRWTHSVPSLPDAMSARMQLLAHWGHRLLYAVALIALPVSGWAWSSVADKPIMVLGLFSLPHILPTWPEAYDVVKWIHICLAWFCGALVGGHILVALKHHWRDRDGVLESMLPRRRH